MLRPYHWKMFYRILFIAQLMNVSLNHKGWGQISCHLITGSNVKDLSLGNVFLHKNKFTRDGSFAAT